MKNATMFIDGTWLWHEAQNLRAIIKRMAGANNFNQHEVDYGKLVRAIVEKLAEDLEEPVNLQAVHFFASISVNSHHEDRSLAERWEKQMDRFERDHGFTLHLSEKNLRNTPIRQLKAEGKVEKMVDVDMAVEMTESLWIGPSYEWTIVVTGDLDFAPAMIKHKKTGRKVLLASTTESCNALLRNPELKDRPWHKVYWLDAMTEKFVRMSHDETLDAISRELGNRVLRR